MTARHGTPTGDRVRSGQHTSLPEIPIPKIDARATVAHVIARAMAVSTVRLFSHEPGVRSGDDPEAIHQARVATRRLRSDLRTFRDQLDREWSDPLREELRWLGTELGRVRDAEVLRTRLAGRVEALDGTDQKSAKPLVVRLDAALAEARRHLLGLIDEPRYLTLLDRLVEASTSPGVLPEAADLPALTLGSVIERAWVHLRTAVERMTAEPTDELLHAARIRAKRVRYAAEAVAPIFGEAAVAFAEATAELQDLLGEHQDSVVARLWLHDAARSSGAATAFAAGELADMETRAAASARAKWPALWARLGDRRLHFWER